MAARFDEKHEKFRNLVAVQLEEASFERGEPAGLGFEKEQGLSGRLNLALPAVDGMNGGQQRGTGGEAFITSVRPSRAASSELATVVITIRADGVASSIRPLQEGR